MISGNNGSVPQTPTGGNSYVASTTGISQWSDRTVSNVPPNLQLQPADAKALRKMSDGFNPSSLKSRRTNYLAGGSALLVAGLVFIPSFIIGLGVAIAGGIIIAKGNKMKGRGIPPLQMAENFRALKNSQKQQIINESLITQLTTRQVTQNNIGAITNECSKAVEDLDTEIQQLHGSGQKKKAQKYAKRKSEFLALFDVVTRHIPNTQSIPQDLSRNGSTQSSQKTPEGDKMMYPAPDTTSQRVPLLPEQYPTRHKRSRD